MVDRVARAMIAKMVEQDAYVGDDGNGAAADLGYVTVDGELDIAELAREVIAAIEAWRAMIDGALKD